MPLLNFRANLAERNMRPLRREDFSPFYSRWLLKTQKHCSVIRKASRCGRDSAAWYSLGLLKTQATFVSEPHRGGIAVKEQLRAACSVRAGFRANVLPRISCELPPVSPCRQDKNSIETVIASTSHTQRNRISCRHSGSDALASRPLLITTLGEHRRRIYVPGPWQQTRA